MSKLTSIAMINLFPLNTGSTMLTLDYYETLKDLGFEVNLYQCVSSLSDKKYPDNSKVIKGLRLPLYWLSLAIDLLVVFPFKMKDLKEDFVFLTDPLLLRLASKRKNVIVLIHDLRELSQYSSSVYARLLFLYLLRFLTRVGKIIAVSEATKSIINSYCSNINEIEVIPTCSRIT